MSATYKAVLVAPDGDYVTDYHGSESIEDVENALADQGSRWIFYPFHAVVRDTPDRPYTYTRDGRAASRRRLVSVAYPFEHLAGRTVATLARTIRETPESELEAILS